MVAGGSLQSANGAFNAGPSTSVIACRELKAFFTELGMEVEGETTVEEGGPITEIIA